MVAHSPHNCEFGGIVTTSAECTRVIPCKNHQMTSIEPSQLLILTDLLLARLWFGAKTQVNFRHQDMLLLDKIGSVKGEGKGIVCTLGLFHTLQAGRTWQINGGKQDSVKHESWQLNGGNSVKHESCQNLVLL